MSADQEVPAPLLILQLACYIEKAELQWKPYRLDLTVLDGTLHTMW